MGVARWKIDCATDGDVYVWSDGEPTECPNDAGHTVNSANVQATYLQVREDGLYGCAEDGSLELIT